MPVDSKSPPRVSAAISFSIQITLFTSSNLSISSSSMLSTLIAVAGVLPDAKASAAPPSVWSQHPHVEAAISDLPTGSS